MRGISSISTVEGRDYCAYAARGTGGWVCVSCMRALCGECALCVYLFHTVRHVFVYVRRTRDLSSVHVIQLQRSLRPPYRLLDKVLAQILKYFSDLIAQ